MAPSTEYHAVPISNEPVGEKNTFDVKQYAWNAGRWNLRLPTWQSWDGRLIVSHAVLSLLSLFLGIIIAASAVNRPEPQKTLPSSPIPSSVFSPRLPTVMRPDERYVGWSPFVNHNWKTLIRGLEDVWVLNPEQYGLEPGFRKVQDSDSEYQLYHISNLHQVHCLNIVRQAAFQDIHNITGFTADDIDLATVHIEHCVEYLRLSIMCGDNFTLEPGSPPGTPSSEAFDKWGNPLGWGITKNCVNWENLRYWQAVQLKASKGLM
ncbi:hypothetical protein CMQ_6808 [Grosmannia clavigera kw1407]|uniref:Tat pathway signal sequence n=1 Tax=Grosmannia clavigera (strain kw1407 / UAMH 11150) TaxID=655863 RepID=F0X6V6_GROCL|nr:uncharacterized protein CMQ_6808 [Grosmannia clavigera kw1407]EFX06487.1 hypothetical protein CMQ_6808 [Grosmannia clavigera kw1407]